MVQEGIMLYYGESPFEKSDFGQEQVETNEVLYKPYLLQHTIVGLSCLQHKGNMVLKLHETESEFTVGIIFILYALFDSVLLNKPYSKCPLSSG
jgi:hypothetical protein